jgi:hypothetical protein
MPPIQGDDTTHQSVADLEEIVCNYCLVIYVVRTCKSIDATLLNGYYFSYEMAKQRICNLRVNAI